MQPADKPKQKMSNSEARLQALEKRDAFEFEPTSLITYRSKGRVLALGDADSLASCAELPAGIDLEKIDCSSGKAQVDGFLGAFRVDLAAADGSSRQYQGDAILDLHETALLVREMLPPGYFHAPPSRWQELGIAEDLENIGGEFDKPKYFVYDESICAHGVNGKTVCTRCIDACPAEAIHSIGEIVEVDANLCQGGGTCGTVCPSGAIRYLYPNLRDSGKRLRDVLAAYLGGGSDPVILFHAESYDPAAYLENYDNAIPLAVEELASVGMDQCLAALAYGATQVVLLVDDGVPRGSRAALGEQLDWLHALIGELGFGSAQVCLLDADAALPELDAPPRVNASQLDMPPGKRNAIHQALDHLVKELRPAADVVPLPAGAPFGDVAIDGEKCTLCMACIGACPGRALQDGSNREVPEVFFIESNCLQCGACVQTCPEDAVSLNPRMVFDRETRNRSRVLNRDTPFACISCGKPFAPSSVIHKMLDKLSGHHMFGTQRALDRLKMCDDCRVVDVVQDPEAMGGQFDPLKGFRE